MDNSQPGQVFVPIPHDDDTSAEPQQPSTGAPEPVRPPEQPELPSPAPQPSPAPEPLSPEDNTAPQPEPTTLDQPQTQDAGWQYQEGMDSAGEQQELPDSVDWTAAEFVEHQKSTGWYGLLVLAGLVMAAICYLSTKDIISTGAVAIAVIFLGVYASHKPRMQQYHLSRDGIQIGSKLFGFENFKTFSVVEEGSLTGIVFMPMRRFMPPTTIYVQHESEDRVLDYLSAFLPLEQHHSDAIDSLLRRIRF